MEETDSKPTKKEENGKKSKPKKEKVPPIYVHETVIIRCTPQQAFDYLCKSENHTSLHPYLVSLVNSDVKVGEDGVVSKTSKIVEELPVLGIFKSKARSEFLVTEDPNTFTRRSVMVNDPKIDLEHHHFIKDIGNGQVEVTSQMKGKTLFGFNRISQNYARTAHRRMLDGLKKLIEEELEKDNKTSDGSDSKEQSNDKDN